jgi:3D (Asp-Asp-Asp) domain-containing protein
MSLRSAGSLIALLSVTTLLPAGCTRPPASSSAPAARNRMAFQATAYSIEGRTASGVRSREGIVAADPAILPLGTRIRVHGAGEYSGEYVVRDTGPAVKGHEIDVYLANDREAKRFGRKPVEVEVLAYGDGRPLTRAE